MTFEPEIFYSADEGCAIPTAYPFTLVMMDKHGQMTEQLIRQRSDIDLRKVVAFKVQQPDEIQSLVHGFFQQDGSKPSNHLGIVTRVIEYLAREGELVCISGADFNQNNWLDKRMDELGYRNATDRERIRYWAEHPGRDPELRMDIGNKILVSMASPTGYGRVILCPNGHTLAYSAAQGIWNAICGRESPYGTYSYGNRLTISAGEHRGGQNWRHAKQRLTIDSKGVQIGCQRIPMDAIVNLAEREGWSGKPKF